MKNYTENKIEKLRARAHKLIPSGAHTYSRSDRVFPSNSPAFFNSGHGAWCEDLSGKKFLDYGMGLWSVTLGHAFPEIIESIKNQLTLGNSFSRPHLLEGDLAEELIDLYNNAEMVKFAKNGSDVTSAAIRLARAYTGRELIIRIKEQPFHSFNDWFIGSTSRSSGVPDSVKALVLSVNYNDKIGLESIFEKNHGKIAAVIMEPMTFDEPSEDYLHQVQKMCSKNGALLIFDEIITGFRWHLKGAQHFFDVKPDLTTLGKGFANGFPCAALLGKKEIMKLGDFEGPVFLLSCTNGAELVGLTAAKTTIAVYKNHKVIEHLWAFGKSLQEKFNQLIRERKLESVLEIKGFPCRLNLAFKEQSFASELALKTFFVQEMIKHGILMEQLANSFSHGPEELEKTIDGVSKTLDQLKIFVDRRDIKSKIEGKIISKVFHY